MSGSPHEVASQALGHELPAPTTLDGFRPASPDEIKTFVVSIGLSPERCEDVAKDLKDELNITSIVQYEWWLGEYSLKEWFHSHDTWKTDAPLYVALAYALKTCSAMNQAKAKQ